MTLVRQLRRELEEKVLIERSGSDGPNLLRAFEYSQFSINIIFAFIIWCRWDHCSTAFPSLSVEAVLGGQKPKKAAGGSLTVYSRGLGANIKAHRKVHCKLSSTAVSPFYLSEMNSSVRVVPFTFLLLLFLPTFLLHCAIPGICRDELVHLPRTVRK